MLELMFKKGYSYRPTTEKEAEIKSSYEATNLDDMEIGESLYLTAEASRPRLTRVNPDFRFLWGADADQPDYRELAGFSEEMVPFIDTALALILSVNDQALNIARVVFRDNRAILTVPGKAAVRLSRLVGNAVPGRIHVSGWNDRSWQDLEARLQSYSILEKRTNDLLSGPSRWLSLAVGEVDIVRKFLFAYCGLEILANKFISQSRTTLINKLDKQLTDIPIDEFLWPKMPDEKAPQRNLVFAFPAMSTLVSVDTAVYDTWQFREIAKARNALAYGDAEDLANLPVSIAITLLMRYISAVADANIR